MIVSDTLGEDMCHILAMGNQSKLHVAIKNIRVLAICPAYVVPHRGSRYIVTEKGNIISCTTKRLMAWEDGNGDRKAILNLASEYDAYHIAEQSVRCDKMQGSSDDTIRSRYTKAVVLAYYMSQFPVPEITEFDM